MRNCEMFLATNELPKLDKISISTYTYMHKVYQDSEGPEAFP